jgi:transposase
MEGVIAMTRDERDRLRVIEAVLEGRLGQQAAAERLELSVRQIKRLCRRVREHGAAGLVSRKRGQPSNRLIAASERERVLDVLRQRYADFGPTLAAEYLRAEHGFEHSTETLRQWMVGCGLWQPRRQRRKRAFQLRERRPRLGELVQIDGSPHAWFETRGERCTLIVFIDDATGRIPYARFVPAETTRAYLQALRSYVTRHGRPAALYSDRHSIFTKHDPEDPAPTQFERAVRSLEIEPILALSPQAKGRVERSFQTLQDRLVKGLRLAGACNLAQGNEVLPSFIERYNERFGCVPANARDAHRVAGCSSQQLHRITCEQFTRTLSRSLTCQFRGLMFAVDTGGEHAYHLRGARVTICDDGLSDTIEMVYNGKSLPYRAFERGAPLPDRCADDKTLDTAVEQALHRQAAQPKPEKPATNHPWRIAFMPAQVRPKPTSRPSGEP